MATIPRECSILTSIGGPCPTDEEDEQEFAVVRPKKQEKLKSVNLVTIRTFGDDFHDKMDNRYNILDTDY